MSVQTGKFYYSPRRLEPMRKFVVTYQYELEVCLEVEATNLEEAVKAARPIPSIGEIATKYEDRIVGTSVRIVGVGEG